MIIKLGYDKRVWTELGIIEGFPKIEGTNIRLDGEGDEWKEFLNKNVKLRDALIKIGNEVFGDGCDVYENMYSAFSVYEDFSKELNNAYFHITGDSQIVLTDSLERFSEGYRTEEEWGVKKWIVIE